MTLREIRKAAGLTMEQVLAGCPAKEIDIPLLSKIERGIVPPPESLLRHVYAKCGQTPPEQEITRSRALASGVIPKRTRRASYDALNPGKRVKEILRVWEGVMIPRDVMKALHFSDMNSVRPRISEMCNYGGLLETVEERRDPDTGMMVAAYRLTEKGQALKWRLMHGTDSTEGQALA